MSRLKREVGVSTKPWVISLLVVSWTILGVIWIFIGGAD